MRALTIPMSSLFAFTDEIRVAASGGRRDARERDAAARSGTRFPQTKVFDFFRTDDNWTEGTVTWLSAPQLLPSQSADGEFRQRHRPAAGPPPRNALTFDITSAVEDELSIDATGTLSILWKEHDEAGACCNRLDAYSKELAVLSTNVPQIILSFVPEPSVVAHLAMLAILPLVRRPSRWSTSGFGTHGWRRYNQVRGISYETRIQCRLHAD